MNSSSIIDKDEFLDNGAVVIKNDDNNAWSIIESKIVSELKQENLSELHQQISSDQINERRLKAFQAINSLDNWDKLYFSMAKNNILNLLGPDLVIQRKLNLSIQMPNDDSSLLGMHADTLSGQSPFEIVMWTAFSDFPTEAGMYYFDRLTSKKILMEMAETEKLGLEALREKYWEKRKYLEIKKGEIAIFSGTIFHGNTVNKTNKTRESINCRFKNLYSPEGFSDINERGIGIFYKLLCQSPITEIALEYNENKVAF